MTRLATFALLLALLAMAVSSSVAAQSYQCRLPAAVPPVPKIKQDGPTRTMPVTGYTVALSWSPEFCRPRASDRRHARQCSGRAGRFGLILHGLWPDGGRSWPQWCLARARLSPTELRRNLCVTPSVPLVARQWAKHGSCTGFSPERYFRLGRIFMRYFRVPDLDRLSRAEELAAGDIRTAIAGANHGLEPDEIGLVLNERGWLREIRICLDRRFRVRACDRRRFGPPDDAPAAIWRGL